MKFSNQVLSIRSVEIPAGSIVMCPIPIMSQDEHGRVSKQTEIKMRGVVLQRRNAKGVPITRDAAGQYMVSVSAMSGVNVVVAFDNELDVLERANGVSAETSLGLGGVSQA